MLSQIDLVAYDILVLREQKKNYLHLGMVSFYGLSLKGGLNFTSKWYVLSNSSSSHKKKF